MKNTNTVIDSSPSPMVEKKSKFSKEMRATISHLRKYQMLYYIAIPGILYFIIFRYIPLMGSLIAFKDYNIFKGVFDSPWAGMKHFEALFVNPDAIRILKNTLLLSFYDILVFPAPLVLALLLNELRMVIYKNIVQTVIYMPHFLSWFIISVIFIGILSPSTDSFILTMKILEKK